MNNPLLDKEFLKQLDQYRHREVYAKIILLDFNEAPVEEIQGVITQGSINIDGVSALRRTCSLTMVTPVGKIESPYWGFKNKIKLEVGLKNFINKQYSDIIWFKQGMYVITGLSESTQANNHTINITGQDKMCLLNGTVGGNLPSSVDFGQIEDIDVNGNSTITKIKLQEIIKNAVHVYGEEALHNIIINDLDTYGLELLEYRGDEDHPLYMLRALDGTVNQISFTNYIKDDTGFKYDTLINGYFNQNEPDKIYFNKDTSTWEKNNENGTHTIAKIQYGQTVGYRKTDLVYAGDLIANINEALTSVLNKIKNMLVNFEYFYDIDGRFVFQKKQTYQDTSFNNIQVDGNNIYISPSEYTSQYEYEFENNTLVSSFNSNPQLNNVKNDYSVWGQRDSVSGQKIPIHLRIAIDTKPKYYKNFNGVEYEIKEIDWREIIYQMALDYFQYGQDANFESKIIENNGSYYPTGKTGYEKYYTDLQGFWRQLYDPDATEYIDDVYILGGYELVDKEKEREKDENNFADCKMVWYDKDNREYKLIDYEDDVEYKDYNCYRYITQQDNKEYYTRIKDIQELDLQKYYLRIANYRYLNNRKNEFYKYTKNIEGYDKEYTKYEELLDTDKVVHKSWSSIINDNPENLNFWFDFIEANNSELGKYSISSIGDRPKVVNNNNIKALIYREIPNVLFLNKEDFEDLKNNKEAYADLTGYTFINMPQNFENYFSISSQGLSAYNKFEDLLYQHSYCTDSVSITAIPIYYLEPNRRIKVYDDQSKVNGDYIVSKITIPLVYNGTSAITATKAVERIL